MMSSENKKDSENSEINPNFSSEQDEIMDVLNRNALLRCRTKIVKDLDVRLIIDSLIETKVIDTNFYEQLKGQVCKGTSINDVRRFWPIFDLPTYLNPIWSDFA